MLITFLPALNGDCILLTSNEGNVLIDGGYVNTYNDYLRNRLIELSDKNQFLSLCVVTHIDSDHISGIEKLFQENEENNIIEIRNIWHNSFRHLQQDAHTIDETVEEVSIFPSILHREIRGITNISAEQGSNLASMIIKSGTSWNKQFGENAVIRNKEFVELENGIRIRVLSPSKEKLDSLYAFWKKELYKKGIIEGSHSLKFWDDAFEFLLAKEKQKIKNKQRKISVKTKYDFEKIVGNLFEIDNSVTNGSSISFVLEINDKRFLMLGDAHPDIIVEELQELYNLFPVQFDLIKLSHHGSFSNNSPELLSMIDSDKFVFSTNGNIYQHPDIETVVWILTKDTERVRTLYFNYKLEISNELLKDEYTKNYKFNIVVPENGKPLEIHL